MSLLSMVSRMFKPQPKAVITTSRQLEQVLIADGSDTASGVFVTPEVALMVTGISTAVALIAETVAQLPKHIYTQKPDGSAAKDLNHPLLPLLKYRPNNWQDAFQFYEMMTAHMLLFGNAYAFKNTLGSGKLYALHPIHPDRVNPVQDERYNVTYEIYLPDGSYVTLPAEKILHIRDRALDGIKGVSRLKMGRDAIGLARATEKWGAQLFKNGARPSGVLSTEMPLTEEQFNLIATSWKSAHGGDNALGTAVLDNGMKWAPIVMNNVDAQFLETRKFQLAEIARIYRVPPHMLGDLDRATFSNIEEQSQEFVTYTLMPWIKRWESALNSQLFKPQTAYIEFSVEGLLRGKTIERYQSYQIAIMSGIMNPNEARIKENLPPYEGGDEFMPAASLYGTATTETKSEGDMSDVEEDPAITD